MVSRKNNNGFTLAELAIVIGLVSVVSAIAIPNIISWLPEMRLKRAARDLYSNMVNTRMNAIKENRSWSIVFDAANNRYFICNDPGADGSWTGVGDLTGTGDNRLFGALCTGFCTDGSLFTADPRNCSQRESGIVFGHGDATTPVGAAFTADNVAYANKNVVFNSQGTADGGYVYLENDNVTTSFAIGTQTTGLIRLLKSEKGAAAYVQ